MVKGEEQGGGGGGEREEEMREKDTWFLNRNK
jgi:hypothetical protein